MSPAGTGGSIDPASHERRKMMTTTPSAADDPRWARIVARDKAADGHLWYSVATTGIYCRPSCPSRIANPKNVRLHDSVASARASGFRPCRRCNPDGPSLESENAAQRAEPQPVELAPHRTPPSQTPCGCTSFYKPADAHLASASPAERAVFSARHASHRSIICGTA